MDSDNDDLDEDIERLKIILQDGDSDEGEASDGELRDLDDEEPYADVDYSRPTTSSDVTASSFPTTSMGTEGDESLLRFDPSTISPETCLAMNQAYQEVLLDTLRQIEIALSENRAKQKDLNNDLENKGKSTDKCIIPKARRVVFDKPYFKDSEGHIPPPNEDVIIKQKMNESKQYVRPKPGWTRLQRQTLVNAVKSDAYQQLLRPILNKLELETERANDCTTEEEIAQSQATVERLSNEIKEIEKTPVEELLKKIDNSKIDYLKISVNEFNGKFDAVECQCMWENALRPGINKSRWSELEEGRLVELVEQHGMRNWKTIAEELGTFRTPFQCLQHFQMKHFDYEQGDWTEAEDELLRDVVDTCKYGVGTIPWQQVAYYTDRRSAAMCRQRWEKIDPSFTRGRWTEVEDMMLLASVQMMGGLEDWQVIQEFVPGRSAQQCRERYNNCLNSAINFDRFSYLEDRQLLRKYNEVGAEWLTISNTMKGRTDLMVRRRYDKLMQWKSMHETLMEQPACVRDRILHPAFTVDAQGMYWLKNLANPGCVPNSISCGKVKLELKNDMEDVNQESIQQRTVNGENIDTENVTHNSENQDESVSKNCVKQEFQSGHRYTAEEMWECLGTEDLKQDLETFLQKSAIQLTDYYQQHDDLNKGEVVVPRPPPLNKYSLAHFKHQIGKMSHLHKALKSQIEKDVKFLQEYADQNPNTSSSLNCLATLQQQDLEEADVLETVCTYLCENFGGKLPGKFTVKKLIKAARQNEMKRKKKRKKPHLVEEDEEEMTDEEETEDEDSTFYWSDDDRDDTVQKDDVGSSSDDDEYFASLRELAEREKSGQRTIIRTWSHDARMSFRKDMKLHSELNRLISSILKMHLKRRQTGRRKRFNMFPTSTVVKEKETMDKKTVLLLMKSLDVDAKAVSRKAYRSQQRIAALAKKTASDSSKRTRSQTSKIPQQLGFMKEEAREAEAVLELRSELKLSDDDLGAGQGDPDDLESGEPRPGTSRQDQDSTSMVGKEHASSTYDKLLPYQPPNKSNLKGMKNLLYQHKILIDHAGGYFNPDELRRKLYEMKKRGPNPMMNVLMSISKAADSAGIRRDRSSRAPSDDARSSRLTATRLRQLKQETIEAVKKTGDFMKLKARFLAVFLWPALMSTVVPPKNHMLPQKLIEKLKLQGKVDTSKTANSGKTRSAIAINAKKSSTQTNASRDSAEGNDVSTNIDDDSTNIDDVIHNSGSTELDKDMPEEEAIEKLVRKIMDEYSANRRKVRNHSRFGQYKKKPSERMQRASENRMRLLILRRLGLEERIKELQKKKLEEEGKKQMAESEAVETTSHPSASHKNKSTGKVEKEKLDVEKRKTEGTNTEMNNSSSKENVNPARNKQDTTSASKNDPKTSAVSTELTKGKSNKKSTKSDVTSISESNESVIDIETDGATAEDEGETFTNSSCKDNSIDSNPGQNVMGTKRKRGRQLGSKLVCDTEPTRKSERKSSRLSFSQDKKKPSTNPCVKLRRLLPGKMSDLVAKIPDIPILNEPMPEPASKKMLPSKDNDCIDSSPWQIPQLTAKKVFKEAKVRRLKNVSKFRQRMLKEKTEKIKALERRRCVKSSLKTLKANGPTHGKNNSGQSSKSVKPVLSRAKKAQFADLVNKSKSLSRDHPGKSSSVKKVEASEPPAEVGHQVCETTKEKMKAKLAAKALNLSGNNSPQVSSSSVVQSSQTNNTTSTVANVLSIANIKTVVNPSQQIVLIPTGVNNQLAGVPIVSLQRCGVVMANTRKRSHAEQVKPDGEPSAKSMKHAEQKNMTEKTVSFKAGITSSSEGQQGTGSVNQAVLHQAMLTPVTKILLPATVPSSATLLVMSSNALPISSKPASKSGIQAILPAADRSSKLLGLKTYSNSGVRAILPASSAPSKSSSMQTTLISGVRAIRPATSSSSKSSTIRKTYNSGDGPISQAASLSTKSLCVQTTSNSSVESIIAANLVCPKSSHVQTAPNSGVGTISQAALTSPKSSCVKTISNSGVASALTKSLGLQAASNSDQASIIDVALTHPKSSSMQKASNSDVGTVSSAASSSPKSASVQTNNFEVAAASPKSSIVQTTSSSSGVETIHPAASPANMDLQNLLSSMMGSLQQMVRGAYMAVQGTSGSQTPTLGPLIMPVPVTVAGTQQIAFMPLYPNSEGKYVLPNGTVVDSGLQVGPGSNAVGQSSVSQELSSMGADSTDKPAAND